MKSRALVSTALAACVLAGTGAYAQVDTIVVTAQKREQTLQDTPVAVTAVSGATLETAQIRDVRDLQTLVPSLTVDQNASSSNTSFNIRGIGSSTFNFGLEPAVGVFVDGVYRSRNGASINDFLGVERVEVLRGPQSVLFGKNTSAGVISIVTAAPSGDFGFDGELTYGGDGILVAKGSVEGPIVEDTLAFRLDANMNKRDGFVTNVVDGRDVNERDRYGVRGQLLFTPNDDVSLRLIADYNDIDENCCAAPFSYISPTNAGAFALLGVTQLPVDPNAGQIAIDGSVRSVVQNSGLSGELNWDFDGFTFTSLTAWRNYDEEQDIDPDWVDKPFNARRFLDQDYSTYTQEFRIASTGDRAVDWLAGAYYFKQDLNTTNLTRQGSFLRPFGDLFSFDADLAADPMLGPLTGGSAVSLFEYLCAGALTGGSVPLGCPAGVIPGMSFLQAGDGQNARFEQDNESWSVFGQADVHMTDRLTLTLGLRYTDEEKTVASDINVDDPFSAVNLVAASVPLLAQQIAAAYSIPVSAAIPTATAISGVPCDATTAPNCNPFLALGALQFFPPAPNIAGTRNDEDVSGNVIISFDASDNLNLYGSYSRGFKAGGFALDSSAARVGDFTFDPETSEAFELGAKATLFDNTMNVNMALFDQTTKDFQANVFTGSTFVPDNAGEITVKGLEFEALFQPNPRFTSTLGFTYLFDHDYSEFVNGPCPVADTSGCTFVQSATSPALVPTQDLSGRELSGTTELVGNITAMYTQPLTNGLEAFARGELFHRGDTYLVTSLDPRQVQKAYELVNASFGVGADDGSWSLQLWSRNLLDEDYLQGSFDSTLPGNLNAYPGDPRTYGLTLRVRR